MGVLRKERVSVEYIRAIRDMYKGAKTNVKTATGDIEVFPIDKDEVPWCMLFADDIVLIDETSAGLSGKLEQ